MKKLLLSIALGAAMSAQAQDFSVVSNKSGELYFHMIPANLTVENKAMVVFSSDYDDDYAKKDCDFYLLDSSFGEVKNISIPLVKGYQISNGEKVEHSYGEFLIEPAAYHDLETGKSDHDIDEGIFFSQTLFNNDEKFEYIRPDYEIELTYTFDDGEESHEPVLKSYSIVQDDGTVLATIKPSDGKKFYYSPEIINSYDGVYLIIYEYERVEDDRAFDYTVIYKWSENGTGISKVREIKGMRAYPNPVNKSEVVSIDIPEGVKDGMLVVTSMAGRVVQSVKVNGQKPVAVPTDRLGAGVYNVTLFEKGKQLQSSKLVVK